MKITILPSSNKHYWNFAKDPSSFTCHSKYFAATVDSLLQAVLWPAPFCLVMRHERALVSSVLPPPPQVEVRGDERTVGSQPIDLTVSLFCTFQLHLAFQN